MKSELWNFYYFRFTWYVNGVQFRDTIGQIEVYYPMANRCIARFPFPQKGEYKVIAENRAGKEHSIGYIDVKKGNKQFPIKYFFSFNYSLNLQKYWSNEAHDTCLQKLCITKHNYHRYQAIIYIITHRTTNLSIVSNLYCLNFKTEMEIRNNFKVILF